MESNLNASGANGKEAVSFERMADGNVTVERYQHGQPYRRTLSYVAHRIHILRMSQT